MKINLYSWAILSGYAILNGLIYSWTFWSKFSINILEYVSMNDLLPSIVFLVAFPVFFAVAGTVLIHYSNLTNEKIMDSYFRIAMLYFKPLRAYDLKKIQNIVSFILIASVSVFALIMAKESEKKIIAFLVFSYVLYELVSRKSNILKETGEYRPIALMALMFIPFVIFMLANYNAEKVLNGQDTYLVDSSSLCTSSKSQTYRYIASVTDKAFALSLNDNSICIFKYENIRLIHEPKKSPSNEIPTNKA